MSLINPLDSIERQNEKLLLISKVPSSLISHPTSGGKSIDVVPQLTCVSRSIRDSKHKERCFTSESSKKRNENHVIASAVGVIQDATVLHQVTLVQASADYKYHNYDRGD